MRVTDTSMAYNFVNRQNATKEEISNLQNEIMTQSKINKPSDSPNGVSKVMRLKEQLQVTDSFMNNIENSLLFVETTNNTMESISSELEKTLVTFVDINNAATSGNLKLYADQVDSVLNNILNYANTEFDGKYVFGGTDSSNPPFGYNVANDAIELKVPDVSGKQMVKTGLNSTRQINVTGSDMFGTIGTDDIFNTLMRVRDGLRNGTKPSDADIKIVTDFQKKMTNQLSVSGDLTNKLNDEKEFLDNQSLELKDFISKVKDTDVAKAVIDLQHQQYILDVTYKMSSMILPKSLLDYL